MRKTFMLAAVATAALFAGAASAQSIGGSQTQTNHGPNIGQANVVGAIIVRDATVAPQAVGNSLLFDATAATSASHNISARNVEQTNHGSQSSAANVALVATGRDLTISSQSLGNTLTSNGAWQNDVMGVQDNKFGANQSAVVNAGLTYTSRDLNVETVALGNNASLNNGNAQTSLRQVNAGAQFAQTNVGLSYVGDDADILTQAVGNNLRFNTTGGIVAGHTQINNGPQVAQTNVGAVLVADNASYSSGAFGNSVYASATGALTNGGWTSQT